jgi:hypothetical protein
MSDPILSYNPGDATITVDGHTCNIKQAVLSKGFRVDPIIYAGQDELKWLASFMAHYPTSRGSEGRGLGENRITETTIRAVLQVFYQMCYLKPGRKVDLIVPARLGIIGLGDRESGQAVIFRDHMA